MEDFEKEIKEDFLCEAKDLLAEAEGAFLSLEKSPEDPDLLNQIFRLAHNLKGTSMAVGFEQISGFTHAAENLILKIQNKEVAADEQVVSTLLEFKDFVDTSIATLSMDLEAQFDTTEIKAKIEALIERPSASSPQTLQKDSEQEVSPTQEKEESTENEPEIIENESEKPLGANPATAPEMPIKQEKDKKRSQVKTNSDEDIRVKLSRIDLVNDYIGELVILQTALDQRKGIAIKDDHSNSAISQMSKIFKELQELAMSLRMIPLTNTFQKMKRIVRDTSQMLGKEIELQIDGEETEVDKKVLEYLSDPLVHIVRNAADHGIEDKEQRIQAQKCASGTIELKAYHEGNQLVILITDDGAGIDANVIRKKAISKGIIDENHTMPDEEMIQHIFHPGFSTKDQVSEVSGRGVGMDVVKTNIEKLGGDVKVMTKLGQGSCFKIELPLTLAIVDGLIIQAQEHKFALPLNQVQEILKLERSKITHMTEGGDFFTLRSKVIPLFKLNKKLNLKEVAPKEDITVVLVKGPQGYYAVEIDDVLNKQQIVIKRLGIDLENREGFIGGTILSDGQPALILDLVEIFSRDYQIRKKRKHSDKAA